LFGFGKSKEDHENDEGGKSQFEDSMNSVKPPHPTNELETSATGLNAQVRNDAKSQGKKIGLDCDEDQQNIQQGEGEGIPETSKLSQTWKLFGFRKSKEDNQNDEGEKAQFEKQTEDSINSVKGSLATNEFTKFATGLNTQVNNDVESKGEKIHLEKRTDDSLNSVEGSPPTNKLIKSATRIRTKAYNDAESQGEKSQLEKHTEDSMNSVKSPLPTDDFTKSAVRLHAKLDNEAESQKVNCNAKAPAEIGSSAAETEINEPKAFSMNPAMAKLMANRGKKEKKSISRWWEKDKSSDPKPEANILLKSDPPGLVLARTHWLLKHGESVLPPYNVFHSNSECIAVFCKTGSWSTMQAAVFLHTTAICNAKTMGMTTLGVAAALPFAAAGLAIVGVGMVAAPWLVLSKSKGKTEVFTQQLTDQFWAQAEPYIFVECIEHWGNIEKHLQCVDGIKKEEQLNKKEPKWDSAGKGKFNEEEETND